MAADRSERFRRDLALELAPYRSLLTALVTGEISADEFELKFFPLYADDPRWAPNDVFNTFDAFFADVDAYVADPTLREPAKGDLGPDELRERARELLRRAGYET